MKQIKVYLQFPWKFSVHFYYKYLIQNPPKKIKYINAKKIIPYTFPFSDIIKKIVRKGIGFFFPSLPNAHLTRTKEEFDLIHCAHCLSLNKKPWVADIEWVGQFWVAWKEKGYPNKKYVKKIVNSPYCKKILAWTEWAKKGILK